MREYYITIPSSGSSTSSLYIANSDNSFGVTLSSVDFPYTFPDTVISNAAISESFSASIPSGTTYILPTIDLIVNNDPPLEMPSVVNISMNVSNSDNTQVGSFSGGTFYVPDSIIRINNELFDTVPSGVTLSIDVENTLGTKIGTYSGLNFTVPDGVIQINGITSDLVESGGTYSLIATLDGIQGGSYNAGTNTLSFTSSPGSDSTFQINSVSVETIPSGTTFSMTALLDGVAGGSYDSGTNTLSFTSNTGWIRNPDWPAIATPSSEQFIGLLAIFENRSNRITMTINGVSAINYGDGTSTNSNGTAQLKTYDYASIAQSVYVDPLSGENYKMVFVTITRIAANITDITFTGGIQNWLDIYANLPNATNLNWTLSNARGLYLCERVRIGTISASYNTPNRLVVGSYGLRSFSFPYSTPGNISDLLNSTGPIDDLGDITSGASSTTTLFGASLVKRIGTVTNNTATNMTFFADGCLMLEEFTAIVSSSVTNLTASVRNCRRLRGEITINCPALTNIMVMFNLTPLLNKITFTNAALITTTTSAFDGCYYLGELLFNGGTRGFSVNGCNFTATNLDAMFTSLGTASGAQTLDVRNNPGSTTCTTSIATVKGYTVTIV